MSNSFRIRPLRAHFRRKIKKREVSRSFRVPPEVDRMLGYHARRKQWTKSFLIRDILVSWCTYHKAKEKLETSSEVPPGL